LQESQKRFPGGGKTNGGGGRKKGKVRRKARDLIRGREKGGEVYRWKRKGRGEGVGEKETKKTNCVNSKNLKREQGSSWLDEFDPQLQFGGKVGEGMGSPKKKNKGILLARALHKLNNKEEYEKD